MPPVREPSTKPSAATVLPAPVACSNQKRLRGVGILGRLRQLLLVVRLGGDVVLPVLRLLGLVVVVEVLLARDARRRERRRRRLGLRPGPVGSAAVAGLGEQRGQRARERVDLMRVEDRAVGEVRLVLAEQPVEPEQQRPATGARPTDGPFAPASSSGQRGVERAPARGAGRELDRRVLALEHERLARELRGALDRVLGGGCRRGLDGH